jgi:hypothetical protein
MYDNHKCFLDIYNSRDLIYFHVLHSCRNSVVNWVSPWNMIHMSHRKGALGVGSAMILLLKLHHVKKMCWPLIEIRELEYWCQLESHLLHTAIQCLSCIYLHKISYTETFGSHNAPNAARPRRCHLSSDCLQSAVELVESSGSISPEPHLVAVKGNQCAILHRED